MPLQERKFYFVNGKLVKILHILSAENKIVVHSYDEQKEFSYNLHGSELLFSPAFRIGQVAKVLKCHPDTIRKWERSYIDPPKRWWHGWQFERFYSPEDIEQLRNVAGSIHHGRPRKDKIIKNKYPSAGEVRQEVRERIRRIT